LQHCAENAETAKLPMFGALQFCTQETDQGVFLSFAAQNVA